MFKATTTLSELHHGVLCRPTDRGARVWLGGAGRRHSAQARYEVAGVPEALMAEFSQRSGQVEAGPPELRAQFVAAHGRPQPAVEDMRLYQVATIATRPAKSHASLAELTRSGATEPTVTCREDFNSPG